MVEHPALGVRAANSTGIARIRAAIVEARFAGVAVAVGAAADDAQVVGTDMAQEAVVVHTASHCEGEGVRWLDAEDEKSYPTL